MKNNNDFEWDVPTQNNIVINVSLECNTDNMSIAKLFVTGEEEAILDFS